MPDLLNDLVANRGLYLVIGAVLIAGVIARRVPFMRVLVSLAGWAILAGLLVIVVQQRAHFDPLLGKFAGLLGKPEQQVVGTEMRIAMSPDGHFWARVRMGGTERRMLIDSGATITAVSDKTAAAAGIQVGRGPVPVMLRTANGTIRADTAEIAELRLGNIVARELPVVVSPAFGDMNVLGMNFLSRLKSWRVEGTTLVLVPNNPQDVSNAGQFGDASGTAAIIRRDLVT